MTEILLSNAQYHLSSMLVDALKKRRGNSARQIVIVPDRFTLNTEKNILKKLNLAGAFDITVTSFRRLASTSLGKRASACMSAEASVMLLAGVIIEKRRELIYYKNASKLSGFASEIYAVITLLRNNGVSVQTFKGALQSLPESMQKKCMDIALLYESYLERLSTGALDGNELLDTFIREIPENEDIANSDVYITDYFSFTEAQRKVIFALMQRAKSVTITMLKGEGKNSRIYPEKEYERLKLMAKSAGRGYNERYEKATLALSREKVAGELFCYGTTQKITGGKGIRIYKADSEEEEIIYLARRIKLLIKEGYRYKDISVLSGDLSCTLPLYKKIFKDYDIPFFANESKLLSNCPIAQFVLTSIRADVDGIDRESANALVKNHYSGIDSKDAEAFQIYSLRYNVNFSRLISEFTLGKGDKEFEGAKLVGEKLRSLILKLEKEDKVSNFVEKVKDFISLHALDVKCANLSARQKQLGELLASSETEQSYRKLMSALDELSTFTGEAFVKKEEFLSLLASALSSIKISFVPVWADSVYVGGAKESRFEEGKVFFITGAKEGALPSLSSRRGIFGDRESEILKKVDIALEPTSIEAGLEEKLHVLQLLLMPKEKLFISYSTSNNATSEIVDGLSALFSDITVDTKLTLRENNFEEYISLLSVSEKSAKTALFEEEGKTLVYLENIVGKREEKEKTYPTFIENGEKLFFPNSATTVTKIESYFRCPYRHFIEKGLGVTKMETAESKSFAGTFLHRVFELALPALKEQGFDSTEEEVKKLSAQITDKVFSEERFASLSTEKYRTVKKRLKSEAQRAILSLCKHCLTSQYTPIGFEVEFGEGENAFYLEGEKVKLLLRGKIDRIDEREGLKLLIDYKTGKAPAEVKDVYFGTGVQLYVYMSALEKAQKVKTTGALYYPLVNDYIKEDKQGARLSGFMLASEIDKFDGEFSKENGSSYINYTIKKGKPDASASTLACSEDELQKIKDYSLSVCTKAVDEIAQGFIAPTPIKDSCDYCDFQTVCKWKIVKERETKSVNKEIITGEGGQGDGN